MKRFAHLAFALILLPAAAHAQGGMGQHFIENWDLNGDGTVTWAEAETRRADVFLTFDANEDGYLDAEEYTYFDAARANDMAEHGSGGKSEGRAQRGMTLAFNDADNDGRVSRDEFLSKSADWIALIDRDASGDVTSDDFGPRG